MPPWFAKVMETCEALSLDTERDRVILWERISEALPHYPIEAAIEEAIERVIDTSTITGAHTLAAASAAVLAALREA